MKFKCSFCRNNLPDNAKQRKYKGDFVFYMCTDCGSRYDKHPQLGPKFVVCLCNPDNPKELDLAMGEAEIKESEPNIVELRSKNDDYIMNSLMGKKKWRKFKGQ